jgi:hypothetical protein
MHYTPQDSHKHEGHAGGYAGGHAEGHGEHHSARSEEEEYEALKIPAGIYRFLFYIQNNNFKIVLF